METLNEKKAKIHGIVDSLPPERLDMVEMLLEQLRHEARIEIKRGRRIVRLGGLWKDLGIVITEEDIEGVRQEMWGRMGEDDK